MDLISELGAALGAGFRVDREMGGGGMSRLFSARDLTLDRDVVVKVYDGETSDLSADRFKAEIQVLARTQHPHVIPILTAGIAGSRPYFVMPYASGESLRARLLRDGALPVQDALRILREVLDALAFAHERGIVHRDIKPENILLSAGHAVVADFGIAKALRASGFATSVGVALGTPAYMAPEQATADPNADHRMDLYALSAVAYEMLAGEPPFRGSVQEIIAAHLTTPPVALSKRRTGIPKALSDAVMAGLSKLPEDRPASARAYLNLLESVTTGESSASQRPAKRKRLALVAAVLGIALVSGAVWFTRPSINERAKALAVLPLTSPSGDSALTRLGRDLASTLGLTLDGIGGLSIVDPASSIALAGQQPSPLSDAAARSVAQRLGASAYLTGTVVRAGEGLRVDLLLRGASDTASVLARVAGASRDLDPRDPTVAVVGWCHDSFALRDAVVP
jgi:serine/threonine-protein kinase